jgi:hypothetical protein
MIGLRERYWLWADGRRRTRKRLPALRSADVLFASHAKSGRTWLRVMISRIYHLRLGTPERELIDQDNLKRLDARVPAIFFTSDYNEPPALRRALPALARAAPRLVVMVRDPRDVAVSYYMHHTKRSTPQVHRRLGMPDDLAAIPLADFVLDPRFGVPSVVEFTNRWLALAAAHPRALTLSYETLRAAPAADLDRVMRFLGLEPSPAELAHAIGFAAFDALKEKERSGFFTSERIQTRNIADPDAYKVRKGEVGGYRALFEPAVLARMDAIVGEKLSGWPAYRNDNPAA